MTHIYAADNTTNTSHLKTVPSVQTDVLDSEILRNRAYLKSDILSVKNQLIHDIKGEKFEFKNSNENNSQSLGNIRSYLINVLDMISKELNIGIPSENTILFANEIYTSTVFFLETFDKREKNQEIKISDLDVFDVKIRCLDEEYQEYKKKAQKNITKISDL